MKKVVLSFLFLYMVCQVFAQQPISGELKKYTDYVSGLPCYKATAQLTVQVGDKFMEGDIAGVRRLSADREKLLMQTIDSVFAFRPDARKNEMAAQLITSLVYNLAYENTVKVMDRFESGFTTPALEEVRASLEKERKVLPGMPAAAIRAFDREGREYTLDSFKGKYIFLEFSASWCSWCKKEIPAIREAYGQFKDKVVFITIHLDDNSDKWLKDVEAHQVPWYCLSDLKAWQSPMAKDYNISGVPNCFVIGPDRLIKAKGLRGAEIAATLKELTEKDQGISFQTGSFGEALLQAKESGKLIFMDCYTSWCAPCKMMNTTVFTQPEVGAFFNQHFVNIKSDMEKGEGCDLMKRYGMQVFPTYLLLDAEGNEVHRLVGGHDADEFIGLIKEGMKTENSIAGMQKRFEAGERDTGFLRRYIRVLGGGYRFDQIPGVIDELCRRNGKEIPEEDWLLVRRYLSDPSSYAFRHMAENREALHQYIPPKELEEWIQKVIYTPVFNIVNEAVYDQTKYDALEFAALREAIGVVHPERAGYLLAMLDYYDAFHVGKINKVLRIFKKHFMNLPSQDRFGQTMQLNAMLVEKGNGSQRKEGLDIFRKLMNPADPILKNFENSLQK